MQLEYVVGSRVDGLYDGNNDDMWYPGRIQRINSTSAANDDDDTATYEVLYDDGEIEYHVSPKFLRVHVSGTLCVGTRVFGRYAGGDEWYPGKVTEVKENGCYTIEYDDTEVETDVPIEFIKEPTEAVFEPATEPEVATARADKEEGEVNGKERDLEIAVDNVEDEADQEVATEAATPVPDESEPVQVQGLRSTSDEEAEESPVDSRSQREDEEAPSDPQQPTIAMQQQQPQQYEMERPRFHPKPKPADNAPPPQHEQQHHRQPEPSINHFETDEYASIVESIELLGKRLADAASIKAVLSTLVKQMRAFPQVTADLVHERNGERLVIDVLKFHDSHAVIQCYCFVLLRRLCFLCTKSTHYFLRNGIINFVTSAMRKFAEDAILQASACGALAVFTRVHAGLNLLLEHQVAQLVLATIVYHKTYSIHTRQVHYYACEVLLELCELGDRTTLDALCGDQVDAGLSDASPISLLIFLLRQGLSFDDKKACCAVGTLLMCLAANNRYAAGLMLRLNGLSELSTVMAKYPSEPGIQKYSASASKEITLSSIQKLPTTKKVKKMASEIFQESGSLDNLHQERYHQVNGGARYPGEEIKNSSRANASGRSQMPGVGKRKAAPVASYPSPTRANPAISSYKDPLSFSKFASPIGKAPYLPSNMTSFAPYPSTSIAAQQQRNSLVILDGANRSEQMFLSSSSHPSERKQFVKEERQSLLFETYGVQGSVAREALGTRTTQGIKRKQLKTHIVSAAESTWAIPVVSPKKSMRDEMLAGPSAASSYGQPYSSRSNIVDMGSYGPGTQRNYESMIDEPMEDAADYHYHQQLYRSELSLTTAGHVQQPTKKKKKKVSSTARESFQVKIESETQLRISKEMRSPFASPISPSHKRTKGVSAASKTGAKASVRSSSHGAQRSNAVKKTLKTDLNTESLTAYAAKLFNENFGFEGDANGADVKSGTSSNVLSAREQAEIQERERLSFAEKLHKMIDKAKSTLAVSNVTSDPTPRSSRSTTSFKVANGTKLSSSRLSVETSNLEKPSAPGAVKKTRVASESTPRRAVKETSGESASSITAEPSPLSSLSTSSQPKMQSQDVKKPVGSKLSSLSVQKRPIANLPTASAKSTVPTTRASKPDSMRLTVTPKSTSKTRPVLAPSTKSAKPTTPAPQRGSKGVKEGQENFGKSAEVEVGTETAAAEEASLVETAPSAIEPTVDQTAFSVSSDISSQPPAVDDGLAKDVDVEIVSASHEIQEAVKNLAVDEESALAENEQLAEGDELVVFLPENEFAQEEETINQIEPKVDSSLDKKHHEDKVAAVEEATEASKPTEATAVQPEIVASMPSEPDSPADADVVDIPDAETQSTAAQEHDLDGPTTAANTSEIDANATPSLQSETAPAPSRLDAAPVDDIYADEYNEFDDDGAGDEVAEPTDMLDEQTADPEDQMGTGNVPLDELLSLADQITEVAPEVPSSADVSATTSDDNAPSNPADGVPTDAAEGVLTSSKSSGDLYAEETNAEFDEAQSGPNSACSTEIAEPPPQDSSDGGPDGFNAHPVSDEIVQEEPQTEESPHSPDPKLPEIGCAPEEVPPTADINVVEDAQPPIDIDVQESTDISTLADSDIPPPNHENVVITVSKNSLTSSGDLGAEENKDSEDAAGDLEATPPPEDQNFSSSFEASTVGEVTSSLEDDNGSSEAASTQENETGSPAGDFMEAENAEDRPVSRGADSYAEDGFDFEPEEEGEQEPALLPSSVDTTEAENSADQKDSEGAEATDQSPTSVTEAKEPAELVEQSLEAVELSEEISEQDGDQGDSTERPEKTDQLADEVITHADNGETDEPNARPDDASEASPEEPVPAAISTSADAEDVVPNDNAVDIDAELVAVPAVTNADAEAGEEADAADEYGEEFADADFEEPETSRSDITEKSSPPAVEGTEPIETVEQPQEAPGTIEIASEQEGDQGDLEAQVEEASHVADAEIAPTEPGKTDDPGTLSADIPVSTDECIDLPAMGGSAVGMSEADKTEELTPAADPASAVAGEAAPIDDTPITDATNTDAQGKEEADIADEYGEDFGDPEFEETENVCDEQSPPPLAEVYEPIETAEQTQEAPGNCDAALEQSGEQSDSENQTQETRELVDVDNDPVDSENTDEPDKSSEDIPVRSDEQIEPSVSSESAADSPEASGDEPASATILASADAEGAASTDDSTEKDTIGDAELAPEPFITSADDQAKEESVDADEYGGDYGDADFEETESSPPDDVATGSQSESPNSPTLEANDAGNEAVSSDDGSVPEATVAASAENEQAGQQDDDAAAVAIDANDELSPEPTTVEDVSQINDVEITSAPVNEVSDEPGDSTIPISSEAASSEDNAHQSEEPTDPSVLTSEENQGQYGDDTANTVNDSQCEEAEDAVVVVAESPGVSVEIQPVSVDMESNVESQQTVAVGVEMIVESGRGGLKADATSDDTETPPSAALETERGDVDDKYSESYGDEGEFADPEGNMKSDSLSPDEEPPALGEKEDVGTTAQDSSEDMNEIEQQPAKERVSANAVFLDSTSTSEDLDIPTATATEDPHPDAIESDSPLESVSSSAQSGSDQGNANEQTSSNEGEISLEPETPETEEAQLEDAPATSDVLNSTGESPIDEPSYEDDYAGDADQPREDAPSEVKPQVEEDSAAVDPIGVMGEAGGAIDSDRDDGDRDENGVQDVDHKQALAEAVLKPEAQGLQADSSRKIESETSAPVEEAVGTDSTMEEVANPNAADVEAPQQQESEKSTSADDQQGGDEVTAGDSSFVDPSGMAKAEVEHIDRTPPVISSGDDVAELAVPQGEKEDKGMTPGEPGVNNEKDESIEPERDVAGAVALENGDAQDHVHATEFPSDESEGIGKEVDSVDVNAVPETTTALPTKGEEGESNTAEPGTSNESSSAHETEALLEEAPVSEELSKVSESQQSAPEFASYDNFKDQGDSETSPPPVNEPASTLEANVVDNEGITESSQVDADDVVSGGDQAELLQEAASAEESEPLQAVEDTADGGRDYERETEQESAEKSELPPLIEPDNLPSVTGTKSTEPPAVPSDETLEAENGGLSAEPAASVDEEAEQIEDQAGPVAENAELSEPDEVESDSTITETEQPVSEELQKVEVDAPVPEASVSLDTEDEVVSPVDVDEPVVEENVEQLSSALSCDPGETVNPEVVHLAEIGVSGAGESEPELAEAVPAGEPTLQVAAESQPEAESPKMDEYEDFETEAPIAATTVEADTNDVVVKEGAEQVGLVSSSESLATIDSEVAQPVENGASGDADGEAEQSEAGTTEPTLQVPAEQHPGAEETASPKIDEYDDFGAEAEAVVAEIVVDESPVTPPAPESADAYDDFEADVEPTIQVQPVHDDDAARATPAMGSTSPGSDLYDEFEGDDDAASPPVQVSSPPPVEKGIKPLERIPNPTESTTTNDEDEYAEEAEYNDFEDEQEAEKKPLSAIEQSSTQSILSTGSTPREVEEDEEPPSAASAISAKPKDASEYDDEDYAAEEDFEDDEKPSGTLPKQNGATVITTPTATAKPAQDNAENEYEADYDAEYDDFDE